MSYVLILSGSLAPLALEARLQAEKGSVIVLEFDTILERSRYPQVSHWFNVRDCCDDVAMRGIYDKVRHLQNHLLSPRPELEDLPEDVLLRKASMQGGFPDAAFGRLLNEALAHALLDRFPINRLIATAGCGVNFSFWREEARRRGLELETLPSEWRRRTLRRRIERWLYKWKKPKTSSGNLPPSVSQSSTRTKDGPLAFCVSRRVSKLLQEEVAGGERLDFHLQHASLADLGEPAADRLKAEKDRLARWWMSWQQAVLNAENLPSEMIPFRDLYIATGSHAASHILPRWSALKQKALNSLKTQRPAVIVTDTQIGEEESVWRLAAMELGIPVLAYSYDQVVDARLMLCPDYYLVDGMRAIPRALAGGYPAERMIDVRSHRRPRPPCRPQEQTERLFTSGRPIVLFADPMTVMADPQTSLRCFRSIIGAARKLPALDFVIKFHPLRAAKSEQRSFLGMDESEVESKRRDALSLNPPRNLRFLPPESSMEECLKSAAILLNTTSMSGHEAFHMGIPVVFLCHHDRDSITYPELADWMQPLEAENAEDLASALQRLVGEKDFRQAQISGQRRYLDQFYWKSPLSLTAAISTTLQRVGKEPLLHHESAV